MFPQQQNNTLHSFPYFMRNLALAHLILMSGLEVFILTRKSISRWVKSKPASHGVNLQQEDIHSRIFRRKKDCGLSRNVESWNVPLLLLNFLNKILYSIILFFGKKIFFWKTLPRFSCIIDFYDLPYYDFLILNPVVVSTHVLLLLLFLFAINSFAQKRNFANY